MVDWIHPPRPWPGDNGDSAGRFPAGCCSRFSGAWERTPPVDCARVIAELHSTFASSYSHEISLSEALDPEIIAAYVAKRTGEKYLIRP